MANIEHFYHLIETEETIDIGSVSIDAEQQPISFGGDGNFDTRIPFTNIQRRELSNWNGIPVQGNVVDFITIPLNDLRQIPQARDSFVINLPLGNTPDLFGTALAALDGFDEAAATLFSSVATYEQIKRKDSRLLD